MLNLVRDGPKLDFGVVWTITSCSPQWNLNGRLETRTVAPHATTTELLVAGFVQWVRFIWNRWQRKVSSVCLDNHIQVTWKSFLKKLLL